MEDGESIVGEKLKEGEAHVCDLNKFPLPASGLPSYASIL
ncbi:hypothetical protein SAMN05421594_3412 [Chryseobacterium oleae]|uniref:Uncharacterized protein n=1 Tax=Chryseobacterium oleae TaxID=491207 RepID=A0A1I5A8F8_CHROL|nr:hypothetical protein SAMN05421594_3412 [Chryseobacterium oleae]